VEELASEGQVTRRTQNRVIYYSVVTDAERSA